MQDHENALPTILNRSTRSTYRAPVDLFRTLAEIPFTRLQCRLQIRRPKHVGVTSTLELGALSRKPRALTMCSEVGGRHAIGTRQGDGPRRFIAKKSRKNRSLAMTETASISKLFLKRQNKV